MAINNDQIPESVIEKLRIKLFCALYKRKMKESPADHVRNFAEALVESAQSEIKNVDALNQWMEKHRFKDTG